MTPPIFDLVAASAAATALLGSNPTRFFLFGEASQGTAKPYAVWQTVYGNPENKLAGIPGEDRWGIQVDAYADTAASARNVAKALRDALEPEAYVTAWNGEFREPDTKLYRYSFTVEFMTAR